MPEVSGAHGTLTDRQTVPGAGGFSHSPALAAFNCRRFMAWEGVGDDQRLFFNSTDSPGLLVLTEDGEVDSATSGVERWLSLFPDGDWETGRLPSSILTLAARVRRMSDSPDGPGGITVSRVLLRSGIWVVLHGACLVSSGPRRIAVIVERASPERIYPLLMSAYGLTERERDVTRLVLQGQSTVEIAAELVVSVHTVQQHLKGIFDKTGVRSRRDLVGRVFFAHYEPRFRDNEHRASEGRALRGEPWQG
jgi:DNA-binding CsgD family transcriptional regulator